MGRQWRCFPWIDLEVLGCLRVLVEKTGLGYLLNGYRSAKWVGNGLGGTATFLLEAVFLERT